MRIILKSIMTFLLLSISAHLLDAQDKPSDFVKQLPEIFTAVCTASSAELDAYSEKLEAFTKTVQTKLESLAPLKIKSQSGMRINPNANISELERQFQKERKMISDTDWTEKFDKALHSDAEKRMNQKIDEITKRMAASGGDPGEIKKLLAEMKQVRIDYCKTSSPPYIQLLMEQRAVLEKEITPVVTADDLMQQINCRTLGYIYLRELSYERAYIRIVDHLNHMVLLLIFSPGNK